MMTEMLAREVAKATGAEVTIASSEDEATDGIIPVEEAEVPTGTTTSILKAGVVHQTAPRSIVAAIN